ncbi:MAG: NADP-dependent oxidoreductase [Pseudomonadota bacterium]
MDNRCWVLSQRPDGNSYENALTLVDMPLAALEDGQFLLRNRILSMDTGTRMYMTDREDSYQPGVPLGSPMLGTVVGEVVQSRHASYSAGDIVRCYGNWSDYSVVAPDETYAAKILNPSDDLKTYVGALGANGWTAYVGVVEVGKAKAGEAFVVSAAAGCTGIMAGQIAKIMGCRVIGIAGSDEKGEILRSDYGFDATINYKTEDVSEKLGEHAANGVDIYFDNVGGDILDAVMPQMADFGRIPVCGLITNYIASGKVPGPANYDLVLMKRLRIEGFFSPDFYVREPEFNPKLIAWMDEGRLKLPFDTTTGLENTVTAYSKLFSGQNLGKVVVELP